jgi:hypothetical protein
MGKPSPIFGPELSLVARLVWGACIIIATFNRQKLFFTFFVILLQGRVVFRGHGQKKSWFKLW